MEIIIIIVQILIFGILIAAYFLIKNLLPSYFSEKGKNIATKEDIEEITEKVKTVESNINIITGNIVDYNSIKRKIILEYFGAYNNWQRTISNSELIYNYHAKDINQEKLEKIFEAKHLYNLKEGEIELFIKEKEFYEARKNLTIETLNYQQLFEVLAEKLNYLYIENPEDRYDQISVLLTDFRAKTLDFTKSTQKLREPLIQFLENELNKMMNK